MKYRNMLALFASLLLLGTANLVSAQTQGESSAPPAGVQDRDGGPGRRGGFDRPRLNLSADQESKLKALHASERQQIEAVQNDTALSADDKRAKIRSIRESLRSQYEAVLTPEQQQLLQNRGKGPRGFGENGGRRGPFADLGLTPEQQTQIDTINKSTRDQASAIRNDTTLSSDQKETKLRSLMQSSHQQVSALLTPEQQQKLRDAHRRGPGGFGGRDHHRQPPAAGSPAATPPAQP